MKKNGTKGHLILGILFTSVSVIAFVLPTEKTVAFWLAYAFTAAAFAAQIVIWKTAIGKEETLKSKFLGFSIVHIGAVYLIVQLVAFAIFVLIPTAPAWIAAVVCVLILGISSACMISADIGRNEIKRVESKVQTKVFYIKSLQADVKLMAEREADFETKQALTELAEKIRFSDPMSHEQLTDLEAQISAKVSELKTATNKTENIKEILSLLDERNKKCKILK